MQLCVRAESLLASYHHAKEARSPKSGIVKTALLPQPYPYPNPNLTEIPLPWPWPLWENERGSESRFRKSFWALNCVRRNYFYRENCIPNGCAKAARSSDRQLVEIPGSSKALISLNYNPYPNHNFAKIPLPNLNLTLIQKTKALCKLGQFFRLSRTWDKFSTSCRVPNKIAWHVHWDTHIPLSTLYTHTMLNVCELTAIGNRWNLETRLTTNVVKYDGYRENDGYRVPAGYRVQHISLSNVGHRGTKAENLAWH